MSAHVLYRMFDADGRLLYVGLTSDPPARFKHHKFNKVWWAEVANIGVEQFPSNQALKAAESRAIRDEGPLYNVHKNVNRRFNRDFCECDFCDDGDECAWCDECSGRRGPYILVEYEETAS